MDFELEQTILHCYETVGRAGVCQEETQEAIVPDACPDILRIADVCGQAFMKRWEAKEGQAAVYGEVLATVLYIPEQGRAIQRMEVKIPFTVQVDMDTLDRSCILEAAVRLRCADGRILNPRKLLLRADLVTEITAFRKTEHNVSVGALRADEERICQRQHQIEHERIVCIPQRIFPMSEEVRLTGSQAPELLWCRAACTCTESRIIGSKLIFKGKTDLTMLLQNEEGELERRSESFPFSQILEAKGAEDDGTCIVRLDVAELICRQSQDDPFRIAVDYEIQAQGQVRDREYITLLSDLYSTTNIVQIEQQTLTLFGPGETLIQPQTLRDLLETDDVVRTVCDSRFELGQLECAREDDTAKLTAGGQIVVFYLDEDRQPRRTEKYVELTVQLNCLREKVLECRCLCPGEVFAAPCAGGIEIRVSLEFYIRTADRLNEPSVSQVRLGEARGGDAVRPSVILRRAEPGEQLWDIAKACGTTMGRIQQANELTGEDIPRNKLLLIPSAR